MPAIELPGNTAPFSPGFSAGGFIFVSGQVPAREDGSILVGDFAAEVNLAVDNVEKVLQAGGAGLGDVVKVNAWLANPLHFEVFNEVYRTRFSDPLPARTTVMVSFGNPDIRVEIDAVAWTGTGAT